MKDIQNDQQNSQQFSDLALVFAYTFVFIIFLGWLINVVFYGQLINWNSFVDHINSELFFALFFAAVMTFNNWLPFALIRLRKSN